MRNKIITLLIIPLTFIMISCGGNSDKKEEKSKGEITPGKADSTALVVTSIDESEKDKSYNFSYKFKKGESFKVNFTTYSNTKRDVVTDTTFTNLFHQVINRTLDINTIKTNDDSSAEVQFTMVAANIDADVDGEKISYTAGNISDSTDMQKFYQYEAMLNNPFSAKINKRGEVLEIYNIDNIIDKMIELSGYKDSIKTNDRKMLLEDRKKNLLFPLVTQVIHQIPGKELKINSEWKKEPETIPFMIFKITFKDQFKVKNISRLGNDKIAEITASVRAFSTGDTTFSNKGVTYRFKNPFVTAKDDFYFNLDKGFLQKSIVEKTIRIVYSMTVPSPAGLKKGNATEIVSNKNVVELL